MLAQVWKLWSGRHRASCLLSAVCHAASFEAAASLAVGRQQSRPTAQSQCSRWCKCRSASWRGGGGDGRGKVVCSSAQVASAVFCLSTRHPGAEHPSILIPNGPETKVPPTHTAFENRARAHTGAGLPGFTHHVDEPATHVTSRCYVTAESVGAAGEQASPLAPALSAGRSIPPLFRGRVWAKLLGVDEERDGAMFALALRAAASIPAEVVLAVACLCACSQGCNAYARREQRGGKGASARERAPGKERERENERERPRERARARTSEEERKEERGERRAHATSTHTRACTHAGGQSNSKRRAALPHLRAPHRLCPRPTTSGPSAAGMGGAQFQYQSCAC